MPWVNFEEFGLSHRKTVSAILSLAAFSAISASAGAGFAQTTPVKGDVVFKQKCAMCHSVVKGKAGGVGPNLFGVAGRKAAMGSFAFSPAMKKSNLTWSSATLDRFLAAPTKAVPGTKMVIALTDAKQRSAVIAYMNGIK